MNQAIVFGEIPGIQEGHHFNNRREMMIGGFHRNWAAGIDGNGKEGTAAIVLSGGYEDDVDKGDIIIYTGAGGNDPNTKKQVEDQNWDNRGNAGLRVSMDKGLSVRVIRGHQHKSDYSPSTGYTYAGLFSVIDAWEEIGKSGFRICRFKLVYSGSNEARSTTESIELDYSDREKRRKAGTVVRVIRDTQLAQDIKKLYS
jgi:putative restriction endonuclease